MWKAIRHFPLIDYAEHFLIILNHSHDVAFLRFLMSWLAFYLFVCNSYNLGCYHLLLFPASDSQNMDQASIVSYVLAPNSVSYWNLKLEFPIIYGRHICKKLSILSLITIYQILCYSTNYFRWSDWSSSFWNIICKLHLLQSIFSTRQFNGLSVAWEISKWVRRSRNQKMLASSEEKSWMVGDYHPPKRVNPGLNWLPGFVPSLPRWWIPLLMPKSRLTILLITKGCISWMGSLDWTRSKFSWKMKSHGFQDTIQSYCQQM